MAWVKKFYLYLASLIALVIMIIGGIGLINLALKQWVFTKADIDYYYPVKMDCARMTETEQKTLPECNNPNFAEEEKKRQEDSKTAQKQRDAAQYIAMIIVGAPVFYFHFKLARKEQ